MAARPATDGGQSCRSCGSPLGTLFADLGDQPPSNAFLSSADDIARERKYPLRAKVCDGCKLVQLDYNVPPKELFANYVYFSSYSQSWLAHARRYCEMMRERLQLDGHSLVVELASNDGYLLRNFVEWGIPVLGIDPSDTVAAAAERVGVPTLVEFFGAMLAAQLAERGRQADLVIANNVLAHVPALDDFVAGIARLLKPSGTATLEFPHLLRLMAGVEFDTIYHEHFSYFSLLAVEQVFSRHGLRLYDADRLPTHGGSLRIYVTHTSRAGVSDSAMLLQLRDEERTAKLDDLATYSRFTAKAAECRRSLRAFFDRARSEGKRVAGYGAAAKGNTLLNFCAATTADLAMVADRNPHKQKKLLPGTHIPVVSPDELKRFRPDYLLILPWNLRDEIMAEMAPLHAQGAKFVTAVPLIRVWE